MKTSNESLQSALAASSIACLASGRSGNSSPSAVRSTDSSSGISAAPKPAVRKILQVTGLDSVFTLIEDTDPRRSKQDVNGSPLT